MTWAQVAGELGIGEETARERDVRICERLKSALVAWDRVRPIKKKKSP